VSLLYVKYKSLSAIRCRVSLKFVNNKLVIIIISSFAIAIYQSYNTIIIFNVTSLQSMQFIWLFHFVFSRHFTLVLLWQWIWFISTLCLKNAPTLKRYSSKLWRSILMTFGRDDNVLTSKPTWKLKHTHSILESSEYFCQMSSKSILIILSYTVSILMRFLRHMLLLVETDSVSRIGRVNNMGKHAR